MKIDNVIINTTSAKKIKTERWYEVGGMHGSEWYRDRGNGDIAYGTGRSVDVIVALMFPGSTEDWDRHIRSCINDALGGERPS